MKQRRYQTCKPVRGLVALAAVCAVLACLPAAAQTRKAGGIVDAVYREPVFAPKRVVAKNTGPKAKRSATAARGKTAEAPAKSAAALPEATKAGAASAVPTAAATAAVAAATTASSTPPPQLDAGMLTADPSAPAGAPPDLPTPAQKPPSIGVAGVPMTMEQFLDRLMIAESGGRLEAKNPRSTALGPFQFIESTFIAVAKRNFASETAKLSNEQILALRTDMTFARKAAEAYTRENAAVLKSYDVEPTYPNLRLAFLLGPAGAAKVLKAPPLQMLQTLLSPAVLIANPFMASMTASGLAARSAREVWQPFNTTQGVTVPPGTALPRRVALPSVPVQCNIRLPSCKRWLALETAKLRAKGKGAPAARVAGTSRPAEKN